VYTPKGLVRSVRPVLTTVSSWRRFEQTFSAARLRKLPPTRILVAVTAQTGGGERTIAECTLEHAGAFDRLAGEQ